MRILDLAAVCGLALWSALLGSGAADAQAPNPMELGYTPIAPCRAFSAQSLVKNVAKAFQITGPGSFSAQGGPSTGCGVPVYASAVSINLSASGSAATGSLTAYAAGSALPGIVSLRYQSSTPAESGSVVRLGNNGRLALYSGAATKATGDITGYFAPPMYVKVDPQGVVISKTSRLVSVQKGGAGDYVFIFDRRTDGCVALSSPTGTGYITNSSASANQVEVYVTSNINNQYLDAGFQLLVVC